MVLDDFSCEVIRIIVKNNQSKLRVPLSDDGLYRIQEGKLVVIVSGKEKDTKLCIIR